MQVLPTYSTTYCRAHNDQHHDRCYNKKGLNFHAKDDPWWTVVVLVGMFAGVMMSREDRLFDDWKLVRMRVDCVVVLEAMCGCDLWSIVVLVQR